MDDDDFFDANDEIVDENEMVGDIATANLAQQLFMQNKFEESKELVNPDDKDRLRSFNGEWHSQNTRFWAWDKNQRLTEISICITTTRGQLYPF